MNLHHKHIIARLLVSAFLLVGFGLWTSHFVVDAANWTVGSIARNNANFLSGAFWDNGPTSGDIIKALYGSGDEGTAYTQNWSEYNSGSCLSAGMNVVYTGTLPVDIQPNTIYVVASGTYTITNSIIMNDCSALISSGIVTLSGSIGQETININNMENTIIENIYIGNNTSYPGILLENNANSFTINNSKTFRTNLGLSIDHSSYGTIRNFESYENNTHGIEIHTATNIYGQSLSLHNNTHGLYILSSSSTIFSGIISYSNNGNGISLLSSSTNTIYSGMMYDNQAGIYLTGSTSNNINSCILSGNTHYGIEILQNSVNTTITNSHYYFGGSPTFQYAIFISNSTGTNISQFSGNNDIYETDNNGLFSYTVYDSYTKSNNYTRLYSYSSATLTGDTLSLGNTFSPYFDELGIIHVTLSGATSFTISGATWDGKLYTPTPITTGTKKANLGETGTSLISQIYDTIEVVSGNTYLTMNGGTGIIDFIIGSGTSGQYLSILKSVDGNDWTANTLQTGCVLDENKKCNFTTNGTLKLFAFGTPGLFFTGTTQSGVNVTSGGYYTTGISISFTGLNISGTTLSGVDYTSGTLITGNGTYVFIVSNIRGTSTGITFTIDTTTPTLAGVTSGAYYSGNVTITGSDNINFSGFQLSGTYSTGTSLTVTGEGLRVLTGYDRAGNTTGVTFIIDKTTPVFTGTTLGSLTSGNVATGGYYNTGVKITFADTNISGAIVNGSGYTGGTTITTGGAYIFVVSDLAGNSTGMTFTIDTTNPLVTGNYPTSGLDYTGGNTIVFTRSGSETNLSGYTLYINSTGYAMGTGITYTTGLINGSYTRYVVASDRAGNTGTSQIYPFVISTPFSGSISITGTTIIGTQYFTNSAVGIYMQSNEPISYSITGDVRNAPITGTINNQGGRMIHSPTLTGADGSKDIYVTITNASGVTISRTFLVQLDTTAPGATLTSPTSGATVINSPVLTWSMNYPDPAHISGYQYFVSPTAAFGTVIASGYTTGTSVTLSGAALGLSNTMLYRYVKTFDSLGNSGVSVIQPFYYSGIALDTTPDTFSFGNITNARIHRVYGSNTITIAGMTPNTPVLASINRGALYISGEFVGTSGYIQNGRTAKIELTSSSDYDEYVTSTLTIGGVSAIFRVTTMEEDDDTTDDYEDIDSDLSSTEKLQIIAIFETLRDLYNGDKKTEFFNSLLVMLESKIDDLGTSTNNRNKRDALQYLYDLASEYGDGGSSSNDDTIDNTSRIKNGIYTAPNGKKYTITYDSTKKQFTSKNFITPKYFPTLDVLKYTIDMANPIGSQYANAKTIKARWGKVSIDGTWQTSAYTAPNRKAFYFFKTMEGRYSSYTFTVEKYFDSLEEVKAHIYTNNRK